MILRFGLRSPLILLVGACILACGCDAGGSGSNTLDPPYQYTADMRAAVEKNLLDKSHKAPRKPARGAGQGHRG